MAPERGLIYLLEYQESVVSDRPGVREMPGSGNIWRFPGEPRHGWLHEADHADMTDDELNLPRETEEEQIRTSEDIRKLPGAINPGTMALDQEERHRFEPPNGAR